MNSRTPRFRLRRKHSCEIQNSVAISASPSSKKIAENSEIFPTHLSVLVSIATNAWRAKTKMADAVTGEIREEMKRIGRHVEAIYRNLGELSIVIRDHTGEAYDEGQPMKVVATKPTAGLDKKRVSETLLPSIFWNDRLIQNGEIEIAVPITEGSSGESNSVSS